MITRSTYSRTTQINRIGANNAHISGTAIVNLFSNMQNTFQCVVIANDQKTFTIFLYPEGGIQWGARAQIGLDSGFSHSIVSNFMHPAALTNDSLTVEDTSNIGVSGKWAFRVDTLMQLQPGGKVFRSDSVYSITRH